MCKHLLNLDTSAVGLMLKILLAFQAYPPLPNPAWTFQLYQATLGLLPRSSAIAFSKVSSPICMDSHCPHKANNRSRSGLRDSQSPLPYTPGKMPGAGSSSRNTWSLGQGMLQHPLCICSPSHLQTLCTATHFYHTFLFNRCKINDCYILRG